MSRYIVMLLAALIGVIILLLSIALGNEMGPFPKSVLEHLGTAIFIASVLGFTIDWWLKKQITEDVFQAAMGYELPNDLREELRNVYSNHIICEDHAQTVSITPIDEH